MRVGPAKKPILFDYGFLLPLNKPQRVLVCGDRNWTDKESIRQELDCFAKGTVVIVGGVRGADTLASEAAKEIGFKVLSFPADSKKYGKAAGRIRNQQMLDEGKPTIVPAFHANIEKSKDTKDMVRRAERAGLITVVCPF